MTGIVSGIVRFIRSEPALLVTATADLVSFGADFGLHLTADQQKGLFGLASALTALVIRQTVTPNSKVPPAADVALLGRVSALEAAVQELGRP